LIKQMIVTILMFVVLTSTSAAPSINAILNIIEEHKKYIDPNLMDHYIMFENIIKKTLKNNTSIEHYKIEEKNGDFIYYLQINSIKKIKNQIVADLAFWVTWKYFDLPFALAMRPSIFQIDSSNISIIFEDKLFRYHYNTIYPKTIITNKEAWDILVNYLKSINYNGSFEDARKPTMPWKCFVMLEGNEIYLPPSMADILSHTIKFNVSAGVWIPAYIFFWVNWTHRKEYHLYISAIDGKILDYGYQEIRTYCDSGNCENNIPQDESNYQKYDIIAVVALITLIATTAIIVTKKFIK